MVEVRKTGDNLIFGVLSAFAVVMLFIVFGMVFDAHLIPTFKTVVNNDNIGSDIDTPTQVYINNAYDNYMIYLRLLPIVLFFGIVVWMIITVVRKQSESRYDGY